MRIARGDGRLAREVDRGRHAAIGGSFDRGRDRSGEAALREAEKARAKRALPSLVRLDRYRVRFE
jgi:hypothetical protein